jgi:hypothetical protein
MCTMCSVLFAIVCYYLLCFVSLSAFFFWLLLVYIHNIYRLSVLFVLMNLLFIKYKSICISFLLKFKIKKCPP